MTDGAAMQFLPLQYHHGCNLANPLLGTITLPAGAPVSLSPEATPIGKVLGHGKNPPGGPQFTVQPEYGTGPAAPVLKTVFDAA